jgi:hypothetical protein
MYISVVLHDGPLQKRKVNVSLSGTNNVLHHGMAKDEDTISTAA